MYFLDRQAARLQRIAEELKAHRVPERVTDQQAAQLHEVLHHLADAITILSRLAWTPEYPGSPPSSVA